MEKLIATYSAKGHPQYSEDTWDWEREINNENELYQFMIDIHKRDARNFNDYPLVGGCGKNGFTFEIEKSVEVDGEIFINPNRIVSDKPEYFDSTYKKYDELYNRMKTTLPNLRKANQKRVKEQNERCQYEALKSKFVA